MSGIARQSAESLQEALVFRRDLRVEWGDCDPAGIVFYPRYLAFFDANTAYLLEAAGYSKQRLSGEYGVIGMPLIDVQAKFLLPSRCGDRIVIESQIASVTRARLTVEHRILRGEQLAVQGRESRIWAAQAQPNSDAIKICTIAQEVVDRLGAVQGST